MFKLITTWHRILGAYSCHDVISFTIKQKLICVSPIICNHKDSLYCDLLMKATHDIKYTSSYLAFHLFPLLDIIVTDRHLSILAQVRQYLLLSPKIPAHTLWVTRGGRITADYSNKHGIRNPIY